MELINFTPAAIKTVVKNLKNKDDTLHVVNWKSTQRSEIGQDTVWQCVAECHQLGHFRCRIMNNVNIKCCLAAWEARSPIQFIMNTLRVPVEYSICSSVMCQTLLRNFNSFHLVFNFPFLGI